MILVGCAIGGKTVTDSRFQYPFSSLLPASKYFLPESAASWAFDSALGSSRKSKRDSEPGLIPDISAIWLESINTPTLFPPVLYWNLTSFKHECLSAEAEVDWECKCYTFPFDSIALARQTRN